MKKIKYIEPFRLRVSDYDTYDHLTPHAILDIFQDIAGKNANELNVGFHDLIKDDLIWVLLRTKYEVISYPEMYSNIKAVTWPHKKGRIDFDRDYLLLDENDNILIKGSSKWVIINAKTRSIIRPNTINYPEDNLEEAINFEEGVEKLPDFPTENCVHTQIQTHFLDLDHNGHVNNAKYSNYVLNAISLKKEEVISSFIMNHAKELPANSLIDIYYKKEENHYDVKGVKQDGEISFICRINLL